MKLLLVPAILFLVALYRYFASIDAILSRSREYRADWIAAMSYGSKASVSALQKVVAYSALSAHTAAELFSIILGPV